MTFLLSMNLPIVIVISNSKNEKIQNKKPHIVNSSEYIAHISIIGATDEIKVQNAIINNSSLNLNEFANMKHPPFA